MYHSIMLHLRPRSLKPNSSLLFRTCLNRKLLLHKMNRIQSPKPKILHSLLHGILTVQFLIHNRPMLFPRETPIRTGRHLLIMATLLAHKENFICGPTHCGVHGRSTCLWMGENRAHSIGWEY